MKVLIADDSALLRTALTKLLEQTGYEVVLAEDGLEAVQRFYTDQPDLVLLDIQMPKLHGYVVCRLIKEDPSAAHVPVLILTARDSAEDRYWGHRSGADGYLTKESMGDELVDAIQSALAASALSDLARPEAPSRNLDESDVLSRVCEVLDRKLFEATIVNDIVAVGVRAMDLKATIAESLGILRRLVDFDLAGLVLPGDGRTILRFDHPMAEADFEGFKGIVTERVRQLTTAELDPEDLEVSLPSGAALEELLAVEAPEKGWGSVVAAPLWSRGEVVGVLVLAAHRTGVFDVSEERNLRMVEPHIATVVDSARHYQRLIEQEARTSLSALFE